MAKKGDGRIDRVGERWRARYAGEYLGLHDTEIAARRAIAGAKKLALGTAPVSLRRWGDPWMTERELSGHIKGIKQERSVWRSRILCAPFIDKPLRALRAKHVQWWASALLKRRSRYTLRRGKHGERYSEVLDRDRTLSRQSVVHALRLVKLMLDDAVIEGHIPSNPARLVKLPREKTKKHDGELIVHASIKEVAALFAFPLTLEQRAIYAVAVYAGLREGEIWGLRWEDVRLTDAKPHLRVRRSFAESPKSAHAIRDVPLLAPAREALRAWQRSITPQPIAGLVFPAEHGGCHYSGYAAGWPDKRERRGGDAVKVTKGLRSRAKIRPAVTFQCLRHTCGCHLVQGTWTPRALTLHEVCLWLGHSSISVTERHYARLVPGNLHDAVGPRTGKANDFAGRTEDD